MKNLFFILGGLGVLSSSMIANSAFADVSTDRVDTYKANKLIPNEVQIATINSVSSESAGVAVFSLDVLSWKSYSNAASAALGKYMDWTREDFEAFFADSANEAGFEDAWNFLSQAGNDHLQGATISDEDAMSVLQEQFDTWIGMIHKPAYAFPCEGIDFSGRDIIDIDFRNCTGLTGEQIMSANNFIYNIIPSVDFTGVDLTGKYISYIDGFKLATGLTGEQLVAAELTTVSLPSVDFTGVDFSNFTFSTVDFSQCTGLTAQQILSAPGIYSCSLPKIDFTGADMSNKSLHGVNFEKCVGLTWDQLSTAKDIIGVTLPSMDLSNADMSGKNLSGIDFSKCSGLTGSQLSMASNISSIRVTAEQHESMKADLPSGKIIYVDGKRTTIP